MKKNKTMTTNELLKSKHFYLMALELVKRDYNELKSKIKGMDFETALKTFNGFDLRADPITSNGTCIGVNMFFECRYKSIQVTIFKRDDNSCELGDKCEVYTSYGKACEIQF